MEAEGGDGGTTRKEHTNDDNTIRTRPNLTQSQKMRAITEDACDHGRCMRSQFIQVSRNQAVSASHGSSERTVACSARHGRHGQQPNSTITYYFGLDIAAPKHRKIAPPVRPQLTLEPDLPMLEGPEPEGEREMLCLM